MRNNLITNDEQEQASAFARLRGVLTRQCAKRFAQVEEGSLIVFALFIFVMMMLFGGIAVDVMHAETVRTTMQSTLDRAVLAAADLDQTVDGEDVVDDYFAKAGMGHLDYDVVVTETGAGPIITSRRVDAKANANIGTFFMRMSGYPYLQSPASGAASALDARASSSGGPNTGSSAASPAKRARPPRAKKPKRKRAPRQLKLF